MIYDILDHLCKDLTCAANIKRALTACLMRLLYIPKLCCPLKLFAEEHRVPAEPGPSRKRATSLPPPNYCNENF